MVKFIRKFIKIRVCALLHVLCALDFYNVRLDDYEQDRCTGHGEISGELYLHVSPASTDMIVV